MKIIVKIQDPKPKTRNPKLKTRNSKQAKAARRKQFMREARKLYKPMKQFVEETIRYFTNPPPPWWFGVRYLTAGKGLAKTNPIKSIVKYALKKITSTPNGSGIISASKQKYLDEIVNKIIEKVESEKTSKVEIQKWVKRPHHKLFFDNGFKIYFRPASFRGEAYRGMHVDTFAIMYEVETIRGKMIWNEFYRTMKPGCDGKVYHGSPQRLVLMKIGTQRAQRKRRKTTDCTERGKEE